MGCCQVLYQVSVDTMGKKGTNIDTSSSVLRPEVPVFLLTYGHVPHPHAGNLALILRPFPTSTPSWNFDFATASLELHTKHVYAFGPRARRNHLTWLVLARDSNFPSYASSDEMKTQVPNQSSTSSSPRVKWHVIWKATGGMTRQ